MLHYDGSKWSSMAFYSSIYGIWGSSAQDVFAGGIGGILHYDGSNWSKINNNALYSTINESLG